MNNETGELEIDLLRMAQALWKKAVGIVIAGVLAAAAALGYTAFFVTPLYKAEALMYVNSNNISVGSTKVSISQAELSAPDFGGYLYCDSEHPGHPVGSHCPDQGQLQL